MFHLILLVSKSSPGNLPFPEETLYLVDMY
jgi:hypothetical protein